MKLHNSGSRRFIPRIGGLVLGAALLAAVPASASGETYAKADTPGAEIAADRAAMENQLHSVSGELRELSGDALAGMYIEQAPDLQLVVRVKNEAPPALREAVDRHDAPSSIETVSAPSLENVIEIISNTNWRDLDDRIQGVYADEETSNIVVQLLGISQDAPEAASALQAALDSDVNIVVETVATTGADH